MARQYLITIVLVLTSLVTAGLAYYAWNRRQAVNWATSFALLNFAVTIWSLGYAMEINLSGMFEKILWAKLQYVSITTVPVIWFIFANLYNDHSQWTARNRVFALLILPTLTLVLVVTNERHGLVWDQITVQQSGSFLLLDFIYGDWFWVHIIYSYGLVLVGSRHILQKTRERHSIYRFQAFLLLIGVLVPVLVNLLYLGNVWYLDNFDLTPLSLFISCLIFAAAVLRYQLFDIIPIARRIAVDNMKDGMIVLDMQNLVVDVNVTAENLFGKPAEHIIGRKIIELINETPDWMGMAELLQTDNSDLPALFVNGRYYDLQLLPLYDSREFLRGQLIMMRDITKQKDAEFSLQVAHESLEMKVRARTDELMQANMQLKEQIGARKQVEEAYETLVMHSLQGLAIVQNGRIVFSNPKLSEISGYATAELQQFSNDQLRRLAHDGDLNQLIGAIGANIGIARCELRFAHKHLGWRWLELYLRPIQYQGQDAVQMVCIDFSEQKYAEQEAKQAERLATLGKLAASLAHEINNPLQIIMGYLDLILDFSLGADEKEKYVHILYEEIKRLKNLSHRALNYSRPKPFEPQPVSINGLVENVLILMNKHLEQRGVQIIKEIEADPCVRASADHLTQVYLNLMFNAIEHVSNNGLIQITVNSDDRWGIFSIKNSGSSIPDGNLQDIFKPFVTSNPDAGYGLGLWVSHNIVQQHDGLLEVTNMVDQSGVTFTVKIPLAEKMG